MTHFSLLSKMNILVLRRSILFVLFFNIFIAKAITPLINFPEIIKQNDSIRIFQISPEPDIHRIRTLNYSILGMYGLSMTWLYSQWYSDYPRSHFHFFNDNSEWEQMDKYGHAWDAYNISKPLMKCYRWSGFDERKATLYGAGVAFLFQTTVEIFDGFSSEWGFSWGDMLANTGGAAFFIGQQL